MSGMESSINTTSESFNGSPDDINFDVPLFATYLSVFLLLVAVPAIVVPAVLVIHIILTTEKLHTIYYLFVIHLLATDILNTLKMAFEIILMCLYLFDINVNTTVTFVIHAILVIPRAAARLSFISLAIDRVVAIALPYHHKRIMTYKRAYVMLLITWVISSIVGLGGVTSPFVFIGPFGIYLPMSNDHNPLAVIFGMFFVLLLLSSTILIVSVNVYLYVQINKSKHQLEENMRTHGTHGEEEKKLKRRYHRFQKQVKTAVSLLILGGIDGIINLISIVLLIIMMRSFPISLYAYAFQFVQTPLVCIQLISHSLLYGVYMKDIRRRFCGNVCKLYQRLKRQFRLRPSKVIVLNQPK